MSDEGSAESIEYGFHPGLLVLGLAAVAGAVYLWGWWVLALPLGLLLLGLLISGLLALWDRRHSARLIYRCKTCGNDLFVVVDGQTPPGAIQAFAAKAPAFSGDSQALAGTLPEGHYCPNGCTKIEGLLR